MCELTTGWILVKCPKSSVCTYHNMDFRKNAKHLMCELTTEWILESAQRFSVCTYIFLVLRSMALERRTTHSLEWEGTQTLRRERHAHRWSSKVRGAMLALPTTQTMLRRERHAHRWPSKVRGAMLARPIRSAPSLDLVSTSEVITAVADSL